MRNSSVISQLNAKHSKWSQLTPSLNSARKPAEHKIILYLEFRIIFFNLMANYRRYDGGTALAANLVNELYTAHTKIWTLGLLTPSLFWAIFNTGNIM
jgi:hypothetical protein